MSSDLLNEIEVSKILGLSISTLRKWRMDKVGPKFIKIGRLVRYPSSKITEFIEEKLK